MRALALVLTLTLLAVAAWWGSRTPGPAPPSVGARAAAAPDGRTSAAPSADPGDAPAARADAGPGDAWTGRLVQGGAPLASAVVVLCTGSAYRAKEVARTTTDADGGFALALARVATARAFLTTPDERAPIPWRSAWLQPRDDAALGDVEVPLPGSIDGFVRDGAGARVAGAVVTRQISGYEFVRLGGVGELPAVTTDARGCFRFDRVAPGEQTLRCDSAQHAVLTRHDVQVAAGAVARTELELMAGTWMRALVFDWRGRPLAGARVRTEYGREAISDELGRVSFPHFRRGADVTASADGHIERELSNQFDVREVLRFELDRAVTLRGVVHGAGGRPGFVRIETVDEERADAAAAAPWSLLFEDLDVVRDGRFEVAGLSCSDFEVTVTVPGVGRVGPRRVELRDDEELEFTLVPARRVTVAVRADDGGAVANARVLRDHGAAKYPSLYAPGPGLLPRVLERAKAADAVVVDGGEASFVHDRDLGLAFAVTADGCLGEARSFAGGDVPERVEVTLRRAGSVRGVVRGGRPGAYARSVWLWPADAPPPVGEQVEFDRPGVANGGVRSARVAADGTFSVGRVPPGAYRAAVSRTNARRIDEGSDDGVPLVDGRVDRRAEVAFEVRAGEQARVELDEPPLGVLRGRALVHGAPAAGVVVVAARPGSDDDPRPPSLFGRGDWDDDLTLRWAAGQRAGADGGFRILYRDAGPLELRVRHPDGHATSPPVVVDLPPPAERDVVRDVHVPVGEIRGRVPLDGLDQKSRARVRVTLFPRRKAAADPFHDPGDWAVSLADDCVGRDVAATDGAFRFAFLPPGPWIVRVHRGGIDRDVLWQGAVDVRGDVVDLGVLERARDVEVALSVGLVEGEGEGAAAIACVVLRAPLGDGSPGWWVATARVEDGVARLRVPPGRYAVEAFGPDPYRGLHSFIDSSGLGGPSLGAPLHARIRSDGSVLPKVLTFRPAPAGAAAGDDGK